MNKYEPTRGKYASGVSFGTQSYSKFQHFIYLSQKLEMGDVCLQNPKLNIITNILQFINESLDAIKLHKR